MTQRAAPTWGLVLAALALVAAAGLATRGRDGLDPTFGDDGIARSEVGGIGRVRGLALQPDGLILAVGDVRDPAPGAPAWVVLARYLADGDLDESFGQGGLATAPGRSGPAAVVVQEDRRIVVAGTGLARTTVHGWPDESFGDGGLVEVRGSGLAAVALQPDGTIVVAGDALARYDADGAPDDTFGSAGVADSASPGRIEALAIQPDGRIVVAGALLARYTRDGRLDRSFGGGTVAGSGTMSLNAVAIQPDGRIVVGGSGPAAAGASHSADPSPTGRPTRTSVAVGSSRPRSGPRRGCPRPCRAGRRQDRGGRLPMVARLRALWVWWPGNHAPPDRPL